MSNKNSPVSLKDNTNPTEDFPDLESETRASLHGYPRKLAFHRSHSLAEILPRHHFLKQLQRERLRADRTKSPLSIAVFCFGEEDSEPARIRIQRFLEFIQAAIRETDVLGYIGEGRIALLLVGADEEGRKAYVGKLLDGQDELPSSLVTGTYPGQIFENLLAENPGSSENSLFFLDLSASQYRPGYPLKRMLDVIGAILGIVLFSPVMALTAIAVKLSSPGPVIFRQARLGENGLPFVFYKFRSMASNADDRIHREYVASLITGNTQEINQGNSDAPLYKLQADPRVTWVGRIIRRTSIDELPQFFNVLKGNMSLVGPRPPLPYEAEKYQSWHFRRVFELKPGITGLWQVEGRSRTSFDDMVRLDLEYIRTCSLALDLKILLKTVKVVLLGAGAA